MGARLDGFLGDGSIFAKGKFHGNPSWLPAPWVKLALIWAWSPCKHLTDAFTEAVGCCDKLLGGAALGTYQGFLGALTAWTATFLPLLCRLLQQRMREIGGAFFEVAGFVPIGVDGSRSSAPNTKSNEDAFCAQNYGHGKTAKYRRKKSKGQRRKRNQAHPPQPQEPQAWITLLWHLGLRLPWLGRLGRLGPSNSSERAHAIDMLERGEFPENTLFVGDAGFVGYPFWSAILRAKKHPLVRVGANISLLHERRDFSVKKHGRVLCWPQDVRRQEPPLPLRLVKMRLGKTDLWMLTSVLDPRRLSAAQIVKLYRLRWGIEVEFRGLQQTLDRAKLRSRNPQRLLVDLEWWILSMAVAELFALREQLPPPCASQRRCRVTSPHFPAARSAAPQPREHPAGSARLPPGTRSNSPCGKRSRDPAPARHPRRLPAPVQEKISPPPESRQETTRPTQAPQANPGGTPTTRPPTLETSRLKSFTALPFRAPGFMSARYPGDALGRWISAFQAGGEDTRLAAGFSKLAAP